MDPILNNDLKKSMEFFQSAEIFLKATGIIYTQTHMQSLLEQNHSHPLSATLLSDLTEYWRNRRVLTSTILTVCACLRRFKERKNTDPLVNNLWNKYIPQILRFCLSASQYCHQLSDRNLQTQISILSKITAVGIGEKMIILGSNYFFKY